MLGASFSACPLCEGKQFRLLYRLSELNVYNCTQCKMTFLNPYIPPSEMAVIYANEETRKAINDRLSGYYDHLEGSPTERFFDRCIQKLSDWIPGEAARLLDIGCGRGYFLSRAKQSGWQVFGIEPSEENCRYVKENLKAEVFQLPFEQYQDGRSYDCLTLWDFIEHVPNPKEVLRKAKSLLRPGGILLIATPNHFSFINFLAALIFHGSLGLIRFPLETVYVPEHVLYFTNKTLRRLIQESGFSILDEIATGTDIDRYQTGRLFNLTAKILLVLSRWLRWENRVVLFAQKKECD